MGRWFVVDRSGTIVSAPRAASSTGASAPREGAVFPRRPGRVSFAPGVQGR